MIKITLLPWPPPDGLPHEYAGSFRRFFVDEIPKKSEYEAISDEL